MKRVFLSALAAIALIAMPKPLPAAQQSGIWIHNLTGYCVWATVYTAGQQVREGGFPNWVPSKDSRVYPVAWKGVGQEFRVRVEVLSTKDCTPQTAEHPLQGDTDTFVRGSLAYQVKVLGRPGHFYLERF